MFRVGAHRGPRLPTASQWRSAGNVGLLDRKCRHNIASEEARSLSNWCALQLSKTEVRSPLHSRKLSESVNWLLLKRAGGIVMRTALALCLCLVAVTAVAAPRSKSGASEA
jgi:hypothetical protein